MNYFKVIKCALKKECERLNIFLPTKNESRKSVCERIKKKLNDQKK